jgi:hypothetical protein
LRAFLPELPEPLLAMLEPPELEPVMPAEELEPVVPDEAALEAEVPPLVEPWAVAPPVPPGVPVVPIGVFWVLCWPAPTAGLVAGRGGVPWAKAMLKLAAATAAIRNLEEDMFRAPLRICLILLTGMSQHEQE